LKYFGDKGWKIMIGGRGGGDLRMGAGKDGQPCDGKAKKSRISMIFA
jgi:hypothetical protein